MSEDTKKEYKPEMKQEANSVEKKAAFKAAPKKRKAAPKPPAKPVKKYSFEQWASRRGVKSHHRAGLRAFITNSTKHRTLEEWDACFIGY